MGIHTDQVLGFLEEATPNTDPISGAGVSYYKFGEIEAPIGDFPVPEFEYKPIYTSGLEPNVLRVIKQTPKGALVFIPRHGVMWYFFLGSSSTAASVHTVTPVSKGTSLPTFTTRYQTQDSGASDTIYKSMTNCKIWQLNFNVDHLSEGAVATMVINLFGRQLQTPAYNADHDPSHADSNNPYQPDDGTLSVFTWDSVDFLADLISFGYVGNNGTRPIHIDDGNSYPAYVREGDYQHMVSFKVFRGNGTDIFDDVLDQETEFKDVVYKIPNSGGSNYTQLTFTDLVGNVRLNNTHENKKIEPFYEFVGMGKALSVAIKDGLSETTFYGE